MNQESLNSIIEVLKELTKNGIITIGDSFSNKQVIFDFLIAITSTLGGTFLGAKMAINSFKKQEKIRIKEELRMKFYEKYDEMYNDLISDIEELDYNIANIKYWVNEGKEYNRILISEKNIYGKYYEFKDQQNRVKDNANLTNNIEKKMSKLEKFLESNKIKTGYRYNPYSFTDDLWELNVKFSEFRRCYIKLERYQEDFNKAYNENKYKSIEDLKELISNGKYETNKKDMELYIKKSLEFVKEHNELMLEISDCRYIVLNLMKTLESINNKISKDFLGDIFGMDVYDEDPLKETKDFIKWSECKQD